MGEEIKPLDLEIIDTESTSFYKPFIKVVDVEKLKDFVRDVLDNILKCDMPKETKSKIINIVNEHLGKGLI